MRIIVMVLLLTLSLGAQAYKGDLFECIGRTDESIKVSLRQVSNNRSVLTRKNSKKCEKHNNIQFSWQAFSYYHVNINGKKLSGIGCKEDVNFEFKSSNKLMKKAVTINMPLDGPYYSLIYLEGKKIELNCKLTFDSQY